MNNFTPEAERILDLARNHKLLPSHILAGGPNSAPGREEGRVLSFVLAALTPAQRHADRLADWASEYLRLAEHGDAGSILDPEEMAEMAGVLAEIFPPVPPTAEDLALALEPFTREKMTTEEYGAAVEAARKLYARVLK